MASESSLCDCSSFVVDFWCSDCNASYCKACCTDIHKRRAFSQHRPVPIHEKPAETKRCGKHPDEKLKYWCSCETLICVDCRASKQHKDHTSVLIVELVVEITEKVCVQPYLNQFYKYDFFVLYSCGLRLKKRKHP